MINQHDMNVGPKRFGRTDKAGGAQRLGQAVEMRLCHQKRAWMFRRDLHGDAQGGAFAQIIDIGLESQTITGNGHLPRRMASDGQGPGGSATMVGR